MSHRSSVILWYDSRGNLWERRWSTFTCERCRAKYQAAEQRHVTGPGETQAEVDERDADPGRWCTPEPQAWWCPECRVLNAMRGRNVGDDEEEPPF